KVQEGRLLFADEWGKRPLVPNWRRSAAIVGEVGTVAATDKVEQLRQLGIDVNPEPEDELLPEIDISGIPRDDVSRRAMLADRAMARYELANVLFLQMNRPDSAAAWYRKVIEEDTDEPVAQRAYYALAEVQQALGDTASAERLYRQTLEDYPNSDFAARIRERLGIATEADAGPDSTQMASDAYREAFRQWEQGRHRRALVEMLDVAARYRQTSVAPKALTAAGSIYAEWARRDRFDLFAARPLNVSDDLLEKAGLLDSTLVASSQQAYPGNEPKPLLAIGIGPDTTPDDIPDSDPALSSDSLALDPQVEEGGRASLQLETLYASIARNYPQSPYAERAEQVLATIRELQLPPLAATEDSSEALLAAESTIADDAPPEENNPLADLKRAAREENQRALALAREQDAQEQQEGQAQTSEEERPVLDRLREERLQNQGEAAAPVVVAEALSPLEAATMSVTSGTGSQSTIDPSRGGWTFVVASEGEYQDTEDVLETYKNQSGLRGLPAGVLTTRRDGNRQYRALLGQFTSESEARMALDHFRRELPEETKLLRLEIGEELPVASRSAPEEAPERTSDEADVVPEAEPPLSVSQAEQPQAGEDPIPDTEARPSAEDTDEVLARAIPSQDDNPAETPATLEAVPADADPAALEAKLQRKLAELAALWERVAARNAQDSLATREAEQTELLSKLEEARRELEPETPPEEESTTDPATLLSDLQREVEELEELRRARETSARGGINPAEGGWSIVIASGADSVRVQATLKPYADRFRLRSIPTGIVASEADGAIRYRALAGQYTSRTAAQAALTWLADELPQDAWLLRLRPNR
ncbi:MAG: SPOR domain-containing protein, partial [Rhodothermales bacterium]